MGTSIGTLTWTLQLRKETGDVLQEKQPIPKIEICIDKREQIQSIFTTLLYFLGRCAKKPFFCVTSGSWRGWIFRGPWAPKKVMRAPNNFIEFLHAFPKHHSPGCLIKQPPWTPTSHPDLHRVYDRRFHSWHPQRTRHSSTSHTWRDPGPNSSPSRSSKSDWNASLDVEVICQYICQFQV